MLCSHSAFADFIDLDGNEADFSVMPDTGEGTGANPEEHFEAVEKRVVIPTLPLTPTAQPTPFDIDEVNNLLESSQQNEPVEFIRGLFIQGNNVVFLGWDHQDEKDGLLAAELVKSGAITHLVVEGTVAVQDDLNASIGGNISLGDVARLAGKYGPIVDSSVKAMLEWHGKDGLDGGSCVTGSFKHEYDAINEAAKDYGITVFRNDVRVTLTRKDNTTVYISPEDYNKYPEWANQLSEDSRKFLEGMERIGSNQLFPDGTGGKVSDEEVAAEILKNFVGANPDARVLVIWHRAHTNRTEENGYLSFGKAFEKLISEDKATPAKAFWLTQMRKDNPDFTNNPFTVAIRNNPWLSGKNFVVETSNTDAFVYLGQEGFEWKN